LLLLNHKDIRIELETLKESMTLKCLHSDQKNIINITLSSAALLENNTDDRLDTTSGKFERSIRFCPSVSDTRKRVIGVVAVEMNGALMCHFSWLWANNICTLLLPPPKKRKEFALAPLGRAVLEEPLPFFNKTIMDINPVMALISTSVRSDGGINVSHKTLSKNPKDKWVPLNCIILSPLVNERKRITKNVTIVPCKTQGGLGVEVEGTKGVFLGWFWDEESECVRVKDFYQDEAQFNCKTSEWESIFDEEYIEMLEEELVDLKARLAKEEAQSFDHFARSMHAAELAFESFDFDELEKMGADEVKKMIEDKNKEIGDSPISFSTLEDAREMREITLEHLRSSISNNETAIAKFRAQK